MPTLISPIFIHGFETIATLEPMDATSEAILESGRYLLRGPFRLTLAGSVSDVVNLTSTSNPFVVAQSAGNQWFVKESGPRNFPYAGNFSVQPHPDGPWLKAKFIGFALGPATRNIAVFSLNGTTISLIGHAAFSVEQRLLYPSSQGPQQAPIAEALHPEIPNFPGFFLRAYSGGYAFFCHTYNKTSVVDPVTVANVEIPPDNELVFHIQSANSLVTPPPLRINRLSGNSPPAITVHASTLAALPNMGDNDFTYAFVNTIEAAEGWLSVAAFFDEELTLQRLHQTVGLFAVASTRLFTSTDRLSFHLPLPRASGSESAELTQFLYQHSEVDGGPVAAVRPRDRHYGLRIRGLGSTRTPSAVLDANLVRVALRVPAGGLAPQRVGNNLLNFGTFEFEGGYATPFKLPRRSTPKRSIIVPKPDPQDASAPRVLEVPAGLMTLQCVNSPTPSPTAGTILVDTGKQIVEFQQAQLFSPPTGTSGTGRSPRNFDRWMLARDSSKPVVRFDADDRGIFPQERDKWMDQSNGWNSVAREFTLQEYPGAAVHIDGPATSNHLALTGLNSPVKTSVTTAFGGTTKEKVIYTAFCAYLGYRFIKPADDSRKKALPETNIGVVFGELKPENEKKWIKKNALDGLLVAFSAAPSEQTEDGIIKFIDENMPSPPPDEFVWPFAFGLAILLWVKDGNKYAPDIARARNNAAQSGLVFDFSNTDEVKPEYLGWTTTDWAQFAREAPALWPTLSKSTGGKLDPTDPFWRGVFFRDLALTFPLTADIQKKLKDYPFLDRLYSNIEKHLLLDYGWKDETGTTWSGGFKTPNGESLTPDSWKDVFRIFLITFGTKGSAGRVVGSEGTIRVELPFIRGQNFENDPKDILSVDGTFAINITDGIALNRIEIVPNNPGSFSTTGLPGFERVTLKRFATDLQSGRVDLELVASASLRQALPFLADPIQASVSFNFSGDLASGPVSLALTIPTEIHTNLFGKWQASVQGLQLKIGADASNELRIRCRLNLGVAAFVSVEGDIVLTQNRKTNNWDVRLELKRMGGAVGIGGWEVDGELSWSNENGDASAVTPSALAGAAKDRDLWGYLGVTTGSFFGGAPTKIWLRVGNRGELTYWIGAIQIPEIGFGMGSLRKPVLLLAHHADFPSGELRNAVMSAAPGQLVGVLRPPEGQERLWLAKWTASDQIGLLIAASGYLHLHEQVASQPDEKPEYLTSLLLTDSGLIRVDAYAKFLKSKVLQFAIAVDLQKKLFRASVHTPALSYPSEQSPEFEISGGVLTMGFGFGGHFFFELKVGWPELKPGSSVERIWDDAIKVVWDNMIPINTFWGGFRALLDSAGQIGLGFALRAGWTKSYSVGGSVAGGRAELGIAVGGVIEFRYAWARSGDQIRLTIPRDVLFDQTLLASRALAQSLTALHLSGSFRGREEEDALIADAIAMIEQNIATLNIAEVSAQATLYADVWGSASVQFLGITLASISVHGYARLQICLDILPAPKITRVYAVVGFEVSVRIGCFTFSAHASIDIYLKQGPCNAVGAFYAQLLDQPVLN
jgi:hypothetical protein